MKGFIEVHDAGNDGKETLLNVAHIVNVIGNYIYTDDIPSFATDYPYIRCEEDYNEIKALIARAVKESK